MTLAQRPAHVALALDTRPPKVRLSYDTRVDAPSPVVVVLDANEPVSTAAFVLHDAGGGSWPFGFERLAPDRLVARLGTFEVAAGPARLAVVVSDLACNRTSLVRPVLVHRYRHFDVVTSWDYAYGLRIEVGP